MKRQCYPSNVSPQPPLPSFGDHPRPLGASWRLTQRLTAATSQPLIARNEDGLRVVRRGGGGEEGVKRGESRRVPAAAAACYIR